MEENQEDNNTLESQLDESQLNSPNEDGTVSEEPKQPNNILSLEDINKLLGKDFKDIETAKKSLKDTQSFVGKRKEDILKEAGAGNEEVQKQLKTISDNLFFKDNPDLLPYKGVLARMSDNPAEAAELPEFKEIFAKAKGFDDSQKLKSVLSSNPRLAQTRDSLTKARETNNPEERDKLVAQAVLATMED